MEIPGMAVCVKCGNDLIEEEKKMGLPLCQNCIGSLTDNIMGKIRKSDEKRIEQEVDNFTRFILSSGKLFRLDDITIIQCCFNIFMRETTGLEDKKLAISQKIFRDAIMFMERELENINDKMNNRDDRHTSSGKDRMMSMIDELIQKGMKSGNGADSSTIEGIEKCIDEGMGKGKEKDKEEKDKEDDKNKEYSKKEENQKEDKKGH
jgi:DNA-directed RNA polymerase subunit RPC12/RpoP